MLVNHGPSQQGLKAMEMRCYHKILCISYKDHITKEEVHAQVQQAIRPHKDPLTIIERCKLQWHGHVSCSSGLAKTILQGTMKVGGRQGRQKKRWEDNIREWTGEQRKLEETSCEITCSAQMTLTFKG